jgi:hypothetical protein
VHIQGAIVVTGSNGSTFSYRGLVSIHNNRIVGYFGNAIMLPRNSTVQGNNVHIYDNTFYEGASSVKAINISAVENLTIEGNNVVGGISGIGHFWNSSARVYGNVIIQDNAWQYVAAAPSTLIHVKGETYTNTTFTAGGYKDFLCITSGTPGTWKGFGSIAP